MNHPPPLDTNQSIEASMDVDPHGLRTLTLGDIHGSAKNLLNTLFENGVLTNNRSWLDSEGASCGIMLPTPAQLESFYVALQGLTWNPNFKRLRLLGDTLADRGPNDCHMILFYHYLMVRKPVDFTLILSNHDVDFLYAYFTRIGEASLSGDTSKLMDSVCVRGEALFCPTSKRCGGCYCNIVLNHGNVFSTINSMLSYLKTMSQCGSVVIPSVGLSMLEVTRSVVEGLFDNHIKMVDIVPCSEPGPDSHGCHRVYTHAPIFLETIGASIRDIHSHPELYRCQDVENLTACGDDTPGLLSQLEYIESEIEWSLKNKDPVELLKTWWDDLHDKKRNFPRPEPRDSYSYDNTTTSWGIGSFIFHRREWSDEHIADCSVTRVYGGLSKENLVNIHGHDGLCEENCCEQHIGLNSRFSIEPQPMKLPTYHSL